jgi:hypothetical protein
MEGEREGSAGVCVVGIERGIRWALPAGFFFAKNRRFEGSFYH